MSAGSLVNSSEILDGIASPSSGESALKCCGNVDAIRPDIFEIACLLGYQVEHSFTERITNKEISLGIAKFVMAVTCIGGFFCFAYEIMRRHEADIIGEFGSIGRGGLRSTQRIPAAFGFHPGAGQFADNHWKLWFL